MTAHTQACIDIQTMISTRRFAYAQRWPNHCTDCEGWGGHTSSYDPSPAGVSLGGGSFTEFNPCETCYCNGLCPRCGGPMTDGQELFDEDTPCPSCGFKEGDAGMEQQSNCGCWYAEEKAYLDALDLYEEPTVFWIYDNEGRRKYDGDAPLCFAVDEGMDVEIAFNFACQDAGLSPADHNYTIAAH